MMCVENLSSWCVRSFVRGATVFVAVTAEDMSARINMYFIEKLNFVCSKSL